MRMGWRGALGLVLSVALLAWTLRDVEFAHVWSVLSQSNLGLFALSALVATMLFPVRAIRWRYILEPAAPHLPLGMLFRATAIGMMVNNTVPARAGELARAYALSRESHTVGFPTALASLVIDRAFDAFVIVGLVVAAMWAPGFPGGNVVAGQPVSRIAVLVALAAVALLVALAGLAFAPALAERVFDRSVRWLSPALADRGATILHAFAKGAAALKSGRLAVLILFWTIVHWLMGVLSFYLAFRAVGIAAPFSAAMFLQGIIALGVAVPASPGFFGLFEFFGREGLGIYGVPQADAVTWALGYHILSFLPITLIGAWYFSRLGMHMTDIKQAQATGEVEPA